MEEVKITVSKFKSSNIQVMVLIIYKVGFLSTLIHCPFSLVRSRSLFFSPLNNKKSNSEILLPNKFLSLLYTFLISIGPIRMEHLSLGFCLSEFGESQELKSPSPSHFIETESLYIASAVLELTM